MPKVSVVVPVYNSEEFLRPCLDSLCNQTLSDTEILCVNDASTDESLDILRTYAHRDKRFVIIDFSENRGVSIARNAALDRARGEYIGFVDSDDFVDVDFFEKLYEGAANNGADIAKGRMQEIIGYTTIPIDTCHVKVPLNKYYFYREFTTAIYLTELLRKYAIRFMEDISYGEDHIFLLQAVARASKVFCVNDSYYNYYRRENSADSPVLDVDKVRSIIRNAHITLDFLNNTDAEKEGYQIVFNRRIHIIRFLCERVSHEHREHVCRLLAKGILALYEQCKYKNEILGGKPLYMHGLIRAQHVADLAKYLQKPRKMQHIDELRLQISLSPSLDWR